MFKCIAEGFKKRHLKNMVVKDERVLSFYNLDTAKQCIVFWVADDVPVSSVNKVREALVKHMDVCLLAFIRKPKLCLEQIQFRDSRVQELLNRKEGMLIDLSLNPDVWENYIVGVAKASCKIGYGMGHDIDFEGVKDIDDFIDRLFKLLTKINTY